LDQFYPSWQLFFLFNLLNHEIWQSVTSNFSQKVSLFTEVQILTLPDDLPNFAFLIIKLDNPSSNNLNSEFSYFKLDLCYQILFISVNNQMHHWTGAWAAFAALQVITTRTILRMLIRTKQKIPKLWRGAMVCHTWFWTSVLVQTGISVNAKRISTTNSNMTDPEIFIDIMVLFWEQGRLCDTAKQSNRTVWWWSCNRFWWGS